MQYEWIGSVIASDGLASAIERFVSNQGGGVTFIEIIRAFKPCVDLEGALSIVPSSLIGHNIYMWDGLSEDFCAALASLCAAQRIHYSQTAFLTYVIDGGYLSLPIAQQARKYKEPHWLPVVINPGAVPDAADSKRRTKRGRR